MKIKSMFLNKTKHLPLNQLSTLIESIQYHARYQPHKTAFGFLKENTKTITISYQDLDQRARIIAAHLQSQSVYPGDRALLLYPSGLDFICAFLGCLYAGIIAVPGYPPKNLRHQNNKLNAIINDCDPKAVLSITNDVLLVNHLIEGLDQTIACIATDDINIDTEILWQAPDIQGDNIAFLQYTSGSTGNPKGVMVSHENLMHNNRQLELAFGGTPETVYVSWLPLFHDMGLISGVLQALYLGVPHYFMTPSAFLQSPIRWLQAVSDYKATTSGGPNFAYQLCAQSITEEQKSHLDLSHWRMAFNGAEPIMAETLEQFSNAFASCGFRKQAFYPCYGLAESTLIVAGGNQYQLPVVQQIDNELLSKHEIVQTNHTDHSSHLVGVGYGWLDQEIKIVDSETKKPCHDAAVGEIWVNGSNVAKGYWNNPEATEATFNAHTIDGQGPYLRTGDLGFLLDGELFITGRCKDLIIIRGQNIYPQDIENTVQHSHAALRANGGAAFSITATNESEPQLVIIQEVERTWLKRMDKNQVITDIKQAVSTQHQLPIFAIILIKPQRLLRTTSGKVQRRACKQAFLDGAFDSVASWQALPVNHSPGDNSTVDLRQTSDTLRLRLQQVNAQDRQQLLVDYLQYEIAHVIRIPITQVSAQQALNTMGMSSLRAVEVSAKIENDLGLPMPLEQLLSDDCIDDLANILTDAIDQPETANSQQIAMCLQKTDTLTDTPFPLTDIQQAYWLGRESHFVLGNTATHVYFEFDFDNIDTVALSESLNKMIERHPMLRAVITADGQQTILDSVPQYTIDCNDFRTMDTQEKTQQLIALRDQLSHQTLPADQWPLFDIRLSQLASEAATQTIRLHISIDMLIADGWSIHLFFQEWFALYDQPGQPLTPLELSFQDYVLSQQQLTTTQAYKLSQAYWMSRLDELPPPPALPFAINPKQLSHPRYQRRQWRLPSTQWQSLKALCQRLGVTPSSLLLTAYTEVLAYWGTSNQFSINVTLFNRLPIHSQINQIMGDFTSLNYLAVEHCKGDDFKTRVRHLQKRLLQDLTHRHFTGVDVLRAMQNDWVGATPFVVFTSFIDITPDDETFLDGIPAKPIFALSQTSQSAMDNVIWEEDDELVIAWDCAENLFPEQLLDDMFIAYRTLVEQLSCESDRWEHTGYLCALPHQQVLRRAQINDNQMPSPQNCLHALFAVQAQRAPENIAVISGDIQLNYRTLANSAIQLSTPLIHAGAKPNSLVAIVMDKGWEQIVAALAVHFSGAAYVPIDPCWPAIRRNEIIQQTQVRLVLTTPMVRQRIDWPENLTYFMVDSSLLQRHDTCLEIPEPKQSPDDLAYILFTSGTTGKPKGVMVHHQGAANTLLAVNQQYQMTEKDRAIALSALTFDLSVYDIFGLLAVGGSIVIPDPEHMREPLEWWKLVIRHQVTLWNSVPAFMQMAIDYLEHHDTPMPASLKTVMLSGDWIPITLPDRMRTLSESIRIISLAGPTETSIWSITYPINTVDPQWNSIPYGKPLANQTFHILRDDLSPCPDWVTGELYIGGLGVSKGYWKDDQKTQAQYLTDNSTGQVYFKSGDMGRFLPDGNIEFLGRRDNQVKLNGFRIELGDIEAALVDYPAIKQAVVHLHDNKAQLTAYLMTRPGADASTVTSHQLDSWLKERLPCYMVPARYTVLDAFPLSANGKVNRQALNTMTLTAMSQDAPLIKIKAPTTPLQSQLLSIWQTILNQETISIDDSFFQLGGNSLSAAHLINKLSTLLKVQLPIALLFSSPTIEALASHIEKQQTTDSTEKSFSQVMTDKAVAQSRQGVEDLSSILKIVKEPLLPLIQKDEEPIVDAVAIAYFPEWLIEQNPNGEVDQFIDSLNGKAWLHRLWNTPWGRIGLILLPSWGQQLYQDKSNTQALLHKAVSFAQALGATSISLTGVIPSATQYGKDIMDIAQDKTLPDITTGHATTTATVVLTIQSALAQTERSLDEECVGFVGLGSIGLTSLELMLSVLPHPRSLILCDLYTRQAHLQQIKQRLITHHGFAGDIIIVESDTTVPSAFYQASLIVGATNVPNVLSIDSIQAGTIIVDDSAPHCFDTQQAIERIEQQGDLLIAEGGMLRSPEILPQTVCLPSELDASAALNTNAHNEMMGCTLSSLLSKMDEFDHTIGEVDMNTALQHYQGLRQRGFEASALHCGPYLLSEATIVSFKNTFSNKKESQTL